MLETIRMLKIPSATCWAAKSSGTNANTLCDRDFSCLIATAPIPVITAATPKLPVAEKHFVRVGSAQNVSGVSRGPAPARWALS